MEIHNIGIIIVIVLIINLIHYLVDKYHPSNETLSPLKHDIYKQSVVDFTTIIFLYLIYNKNKLSLTDFFYHMVVGSFGFFIFYHIVQPLVAKKN